MRSPNRQHNRESFFKYVTANTATKILEHRKLRWSSPLLFNDPFDVPREFATGVTPHEIAQASARILGSFLDSPPKDPSRLRPEIRAVFEKVRQGMTATEKAHIRASTDQFASRFDSSSGVLGEVRALWQSWLADFRILCLTESRDNIAMWYHYADSYRGVVLELRCVDTMDSSWLLAKPISYTNDSLAIYSADGIAETLMISLNAASDALMHAATYTKGVDWAYEREWRIASWKGAAEPELHSDYPFRPQELAALYLGPHISPADREHLKRLASTFPGCSLMDVSIGMGRAFKFSPVT